MPDELSLESEPYRRKGRRVRVWLRLTEDEAEFWRYAGEQTGEPSLSRLVLDALEEWRVRHGPDIPLSPKVNMHRAIRAAMEKEYLEKQHRLVRLALNNARKKRHKALRDPEPMETRHAWVEAAIQNVEAWEGVLSMFKAEVPTSRAAKLMLDQEKNDKNGRYAKSTVEWR